MVESHTIKYGEGTLCLKVPAEDVVARMEVRPSEPLHDLGSAVEAALEKPCDSPPLRDLVRSGSRVAILVPDGATPSSAIVPVIARKLNESGVRDEDITLVFATGMHTAADYEQKIGRPLLERFRLVRHGLDAAQDRKNLTLIGFTTRGTPVWVNTVLDRVDLAIGMGDVSPNIYAGFCAGGKIILPGVAGRETIEQNHCMVMTSRTLLGRVEGNPVREDMEEAAGLLRCRVLTVDVVLNHDARPVEVFAGSFRGGFRAALPLSRQLYMTKMDKVDILVMSRPTFLQANIGMSVYHGLVAADLATTDDGIIVLIARGQNGWASQELLRGQMVSPPEEYALSTEDIAYRLVRRENYNLRNLTSVFMHKKVMEKKQVFLVTHGFPAEQAASVGFRYCTNSFDDALARARAETGPGARIALSLQGESVPCFRAMPHTG